MPDMVTITAKSKVQQDRILNAQLEAARAENRALKAAAIAKAEGYALKAALKALARAQSDEDVPLGSWGVAQSVGA